MNGGDVIGSGGFGCVFKPSLRCDDNDNNNKSTNKYITKVMLKHNAEEEYNLINKFQSILKKVKNYENYFLLKNVTKCDKLKPLTRKDLKGYSKRCNSLIKKNITSKNINKSLYKLSAITMPHGGNDMSTYSVTNINNYTVMAKFFNQFSLLLSKGIVKMNKLRVYHGDIKSSNILVKDCSSRLIDWGLAFYHKNKNESVHTDAKDRPFQFNVPPSCVLFNDTFKSVYQDTISQYGNRDKSTEEFVKDYLIAWNKERGTGSLDILNYVYAGLVPDKKMKITDKYVEPVIITYISNILDKYTINGEFKEDKYYNEVYLKNLDLWGTVMSCVNIFDLMNNSKDTLNTIEIMILDHIREMFKYTIENDNTAMNPSVIENYMKEIAELYSTIELKDLVDNTKHKNKNISRIKTSPTKKSKTRRSRKTKTTKSSRNTRKTGKKYF